MRNNEILKIYGTDYTVMTKRLLEAADLAARIGDRGKRIGIKPNLVTPSPASYGGTTHPEVVAGIIEYLREHHFEHILIAEGSWVGDRTQDAYEYCGYRALSEQYDVPFVDTKKERAHQIRCKDLTISVADVADRIDYLINVPVLKGHCQTKVTCAMKNLKGLLPDAEKRRFHQLGLYKPIAELQLAIRQDFIVVDHICGDPYFEEGGSPLVRNCVMAAADPVAVDSYACYLLGYTPDDVPYIRMAEKLGIGCADPACAEVFDVSGAFAFEHGSAPDDTGRGGWRRDTEHPHGEKLLDVSYLVDEADSCSACYASLIGALQRLEEEGLLAELDTRIGIGQGMQGKTGTLGIGRCTKDFTHSIPGCPPSEEVVYRYLSAFLSEKR